MITTNRTCEVHEAGSGARAELEAFIRESFARKHGARIESFMPTLAALRDRGRICSVAGWRSARDESLYLESYLERPVEETLSRRLTRTVRREEVVEVGNLAGSVCRSARQLVAMLPQLLLQRGHRWIVFTATAGVRRILESLDAPVVELGLATAPQVAGRPDDWGRYYAADPRVMAGYLPDGLRLVSALGSRCGRRNGA